MNFLLKCYLIALGTVNPQLHCQVYFLLETRDKHGMLLVFDIPKMRNTKACVARSGYTSLCTL
jgi:hypothetical protein